MSQRQFDYAVYIGRFQPFHNGHLAVLKKGLDLADKVIVVLGSAWNARNIKNPWGPSSREGMIMRVANSLDAHSRVIVVKVRDHLYSDAMWIIDVQRAVRSALRVSDQHGTLVGFEKDRSSGYLNDFPQWPFTSVPMAEALNATDIRADYFTDGVDWRKWVPPEVAKSLDEYRASSQYGMLKEEWDYIDAYKQSWQGTPFPVQFNAADVVVYCSGHVLLVKRGTPPAKGTWAVPGGFINQYETALHAAVRELKEETLILVPTGRLMECLREQHVFDHPDRSIRGRTFSHAFFFDLGNGALPTVCGGDDAQDAQWWPLADIYAMENQICEDHLSIIEHFTLRVGTK